MYRSQNRRALFRQILVHVELVGTTKENRTDSLSLCSHYHSQDCQFQYYYTLVFFSFRIQLGTFLNKLPDSEIIRLLQYSVTVDGGI